MTDNDHKVFLGHFLRLKMHQSLSLFHPLKLRGHKKQKTVAKVNYIAAIIRFIVIES